MDHTPYTYLIIRRDLSVPQQIVQASHAAHNAGETFGEHSHLICFEVDGEEKLHKAASYLDTHDIQYRMFHETDIGQHTAICTRPLKGNERNLMRKFTMYRNSVGGS